jgi:hypothetical protein
MTDDEHARTHELAVRRLLNLIARLLEEDGCPACGKTIRHVASNYRTVAVENAP